MRPFLKWAGNKYRCLPQLLAVLPSASRLIEPFAGSGAVFLNTAYPETILGEKNQDLISLFSHLKNEGESFINYCQRLFTTSNNQAAQYYLLRAQFNASTSTRERAALFLYLNRHGYNGLCRYNQKGIYNVPFGRYRAPYFPRAEMLHFLKRSHHATFIHSNYIDTFKQARRGDLIYCDPPYAPRTQISNFTAYTQQKFGEQDQLLLAELAFATAKKGVTVIISNHDTPATRQYYQKSEIKSFPVSRWINCQAEKRGAVQELVAIFRPR